MGMDVTIFFTFTEGEGLAKPRYKILPFEIEIYKYSFEQ